MGEEGESLKNEISTTTSLYFDSKREITEVDAAYHPIILPS